MAVAWLLVMFWPQPDALTAADMVAILLVLFLCGIETSDALETAARKHLDGS